MKMGNMEQDFELLKRIVAPVNSRSPFPVDLRRVDEIIHKDIAIAMGRYAPGNFPELFFEFERVYDKFKEFLLFDKLIGKNIVALGGGFSSGKSSFLNGILGRPMLPVQIDPTTSVPTYVIYDDEEKAWGINEFDVKFELSLPELKNINHGFGYDQNREDQDTEQKTITLGHLLKTLFIAVPEMAYKRIGFLDTPGYSKADNKDYTRKTDAKIAETQLNNSDYILWFVPADRGMIGVDDLDFLAKLDKQIPKLVVITKADKAPNPDALKDMQNKVRDAIRRRNIENVVNVLIYSRKKSMECDKSLIEKYLNQWNEGKQVSDFARLFKKIFVECKIFYEDELKEENRRLQMINKVLTLSDDNDVIENLKNLAKEIKDKNAVINEALANLEETKNNFFREINVISKSVKIKMPEPSEIEIVMASTGESVQGLLRNILKEKKISEDTSTLVSSLVRKFGEMKLDFENIPGSVDQLKIAREQMSDVIKLFSN